MLFLVQTDLEAVNVTKGDVVTTVQVAMEMPFDIRTIESPTHKIKMKVKLLYVMASQAWIIYKTT